MPSPPRSCLYLPAENEAEADATEETSPPQRSISVVIEL
jgi:hypothetical protein